MSQYASSYGVVAIEGTSLFAGGGDNRPGRQIGASVECGGRSYEGLEIDPRSSVIALACYFDQEAEPTALLMGERIARPFKKLRVHPLYQCFLMGDTAPNFTADVTPACAQQRTFLRLYDAPPPAGVGSRAGAVQLHVTSSVINVTASHGAKPVLFLHAPGARVVRAWITNRNTSNSGTSTATLVEVLPSAVNDAAWITPSDDAVERSIGTATRAAATVDGFRAAVISETAPSGSDYLVYVANDAAARFQVGIQAEIDR